MFIECIHANKNKEAIVSWLTCFIMGFLLNRCISVAVTYCSTEYHSAKPEAEVQYQQRDTKNLVENGDFGQTEWRMQSVRQEKAKLRGGQPWVDQKNSFADASTRVIEAKDGAITHLKPWEIMGSASPYGSSWA